MSTAKVDCSVADHRRSTWSALFRPSSVLCLSRIRK